VARFAGESELLDRLSRELRESHGRLRLIVGPDLPTVSPSWTARVLRVADEQVNRLRNDELHAEIVRARRVADPAARYAAYRVAFEDFLGAEAFDLVLQRTVLESHHPAGDDPPADPGPGRLINVESGVIHELDTEHWQLDLGLQALGRLVAYFPERLGTALLTTRLDPAIEVALGQLGKAAEPVNLVAPDQVVADPGREVVPVTHLVGYWRSLHPGGRRPHILDHRDVRLPGPVADRLRQMLAGTTICVLGIRDSDPIVIRALQAAVADGARVWWAVPDEDGDRDPRIRNLGERIGGGESVTVHCGVDSDLLLQKLAVQLAVAPPETRPSAPPMPRPRLHERPELLRLLGALPLRAPAESAVDLLRQLDRRFRWRLERPASPRPSLLFWPVRLREPSVIHMVQALAAAALSAHGVHVVLALDDFGVSPPSLGPRFEERVNGWFGLIPQAQPPEIVPLQAWIEEEERLQRPLRERPTRPWAVLQEFYGRRGALVYDTLRAAKILPDDLGNGPPDADQVLDLLHRRTARRLLTAPAIWSLYHAKLLDRRISEVMTLAGDDELFFWLHRQKMSGEQTRHLYHPRIDNLSQDSGLIRWNHRQDLRQAIERAMTREHWRRPDRYVPWLVEHAFLLPAYLRAGGGAELAGRRFDVWQDVVAALAEDDNLLDPLAQQISGWFLGEQD
jgi:hypothetical protein